MKKLRMLLAGLCLIPAALSAQSLTAADDAFEQGNFTQAKAAYQTALATAADDARLKAQLRIVACDYYLGEYLNAAKAVYGYELPADPVWKARFLLYRIQTAERVKNTYRRILADSETVSNSSEEDLSKLTAKQWESKISEAYEDLWALRDALINAPVEKETLVLDIQDTDTRRFPTLFDIVVNNWKNELSVSAVRPLLRAENFVTAEYKIPERIQNNMEKLSSILETASKLDGKNRQDAKIFWQVDRILLPFDYPQNFRSENRVKDSEQAVKLLETISGFNAKKPGFFARLKGYVVPAKTDYAKAYAAFRAAQLLNDSAQYQQAVTMCAYADKELGKNYFTQACAELADNIRAPQLSFSSPVMNPNPADILLSARARNIANVYVRIYKTTPEQLKTFYTKQYGSSRRYTPTINSWNYLTELRRETMESLIGQTPYKTLAGSVSYDKPYDYKELPLKLPELEKGFYIVLLADDEAFSAKGAPVTGAVLNVTDLALFVSAAIDGNPEDYRVTPASKVRTQNPDVFRVYAMNLQTGEPVQNVALTMFTEWKGTQEHGKTNENGLFSLPRKITVGADRNNSYFINPLAEKDGSYAFANRPVYFHYYGNAPVQLYVETDRGIYRPGQKVHYAVNVFETAARGLKTLSSGRVKMTIRDVNYEPVHTATLTLNDMGTAAGEFILPGPLLLGNYGVNAEITVNGKEYRTNGYFQVDDYKRPDYEVTLDDAKTAFEYGKTAQVTGAAKYYFGTPLQKARVKYTVSRVEFRPPFYWWMPRTINLQPEYVSGGETQTDDKGNFKIEFTPSAPDNNGPAVFTVAAEVYDESGRVIESSKTYKASQKPHFFAVEFTQGFYDENQAASLAKLQLTDINGSPASGKVTAELAQLENVLSKQADIPSADPYFNPDERGNAAARLEQLFGQNKEIKKVFAREFDFRKPGEQIISIPALPEGIYKLTLRNNKADPQTLVFLVAAKQSKLALPQIALAQHETYYPGGEAKILIGARALNAPKRVEIYREGSFLAGREIVGGNVSVYTLPVLPDYRGGVYLRWFGASDYKVYGASAGISVPYDNKKLDVAFTHRDVVKPGQKVSWQLTAKDATGNGVQGQASVTVYDQALDYYAKKKTYLSLAELFPAASLSAEFENTLFSVYPASFQAERKEQQPEFRLLPAPSVNLSMRMFAYAMSKGFGSAKQMARSAVPLAMNAAVAEEAEYAMDSVAMDAGAPEEGARSAKAAVTGGSAQEPEAEIRTDFSETAYYNPMLKLNGGKANIAFTMPQSLTSWNILGFVLTKTADFGSFEATAVTRKDLMVRLATPRFYREGDKSQIQALVTNLTQKKLTAEVELTLKKDGQNAADAFGVSKTKKTVSVAAGATADLVWDVTVPDGVGELALTVTARSGKESDGELKTLPVLPSKERLMASVNVALKDGANELVLSELAGNENAQAETAVLQVSPSLILTVLNALPALQERPYKDLVTQLNKYVPLAVVNKFYTQYPQLREAVAKLPKRNTANPAWDENDPLRMTLLSETPWLQASRGGVKDRLTSLFDPALVGKEKAKALAAVLKYQNGSGAFTWLPGGQDDEYLTMYALAQFAEAQRFGAEVPAENVRKAVGFMTDKIEASLKKDKEGGVGSVAYALYASYILTSYPQTWKEVKAALPKVKKWMDWADKQSKFMTPLGKTYAAAVYHRLGEYEKAQNYMTLVLSQMKTNDLTGAYFAPEAQSWVWYNDTMATQTATLQTLLEVRPEAPEIDAMVQWILFNRQAQEWDSPKATSEAVFCLLNVMQKKGLMNAESSYQINWADTAASRTFEPFDWTEDLRFVKQGQAISDAAYTARITKQGGLTDFASLSVIYTDKDPKASPKGVMNVKRAYYLKFTEDGVSKIRPVEDLNAVKIGDEVEVHLTVTTDSAFDYVLLKDPKPAGFESQDLLSGWNRNPVSFYQENKDAATNFYINWLPAGEMTLKYTLRPTTAGEYRSLPAQLQSMYAPEFGAHTAGYTLTVE